MVEKSYDEMTEQEKDDYGDHLISMSEAIWQDCKCKHCGTKWKIDVAWMDKDDIEHVNFDECDDCLKERRL